MVVELLDEEAIFKVAVEIPAEDARSTYLQQVCGSDRALLDRVLALLRVSSEAKGFLESPPAGSGPPTVDSAVTEQAGDTIGPYKLLQQIGEGGMGIVFMAEQTEPLQRTVALKIIKPGMDTRQVIARFEAERQALAMMDHPNIARVIDAGTTDTGRPYFIMDLVKGVPITEYCDAQHRPVRARLELMAAVCQAVQHAHQKGIIHRDLKPSNVLVAEYDGRPVPKIIDFGVAKATAQRLTERTMFTQYGQIVGTFEYMSPEQARFNQLDVDTRSDIYSLGVLLYELLAGSTPLEKERLRSAAFDEILRIISEEDPPRPSTRLSSSQSLPTIAANRGLEPKKLSGLVHGELDWIVMKCLEKDRNRRYETANGLTQDIERYLHDEAVQACPPSAVYRFRKFVRRNKARLSFAGLILLPLVLLGGGIVWAARDRAIRQAALEQGVMSALSDVESWHERENWPEAIAAVKHAEALLATGQPSPALAARVAQWRRDLVAVTRLEDIRLADAMAVNVLRSERPAEHARYQHAFRALGIDIDAIPAEEAADWIRALAIRSELIAALDGWTLLRMVLVKDKSETAQGKPGDWSMRPLRVALATDTDEFRTRVRQAVSRQDETALRELAQSPDAVRLSASTLQLLAERLTPSDSSEMRQKIELLKRAQQARPDDFYLNFVLAICRLDTSKGPTYYHSPDGQFAIAPGENDLLLGNEAFVYAMAAVVRRPRNAYARAALGNSLQRAGRLDDAIAAYREAIRLKSDESPLYDSVGFLLAQQGKLDDAVIAYRQAIKLEPEDALAYNNLGGVLLAQEKVDEAMAACRKAIDLRPDYVDAYNNLGNVLDDLGKHEEAIAAFQKAIELDPSSAAPYSNLGLALDHTGKLDEAVAAFLKAIELKPNYADAYLNLGTVLDELGRFEEAIAAARKAIELNPTDSMAYNNLGVALRHYGKLDDAVTACRKAIELDPSYAAAYVNLASALMDQGKLDDAVTACRKAIELKCDRFEVYNNLGLALQGQNKFDEAIAAYRKAIELKIDAFEVYSNLGLALQGQGRFDDAIAAYRKAIELQPGHYLAYNNLAMLLAAAPAPHRDPRRALELATRATELEPTALEVWNSLGIARYRNGQWQSAIDALEKSMKLREGGDSNDWFYLATAHWQLGHKDEARKWHKHAVEWMNKNQPQNEELIRFRAEAAKLLGISETQDPKPSTLNHKP